MKCNICLFCDRSISCMGSGFLFARCNSCDVSFFYHRNGVNSDFSLWKTIIGTYIDDICFTVHLQEDRTVIESNNFRKVINKKLPITPSNINNKLRMYLPLM